MPKTALLESVVELRIAIHSLRAIILQEDGRVVYTVGFEDKKYKLFLEGTNVKTFKTLKALKKEISEEWMGPLEVWHKGNKIIFKSD